MEEYVLACFGGAGAQHACAIARELGMRRILLHPLAGVLSAYGIGLARNRHSRVETILQPLCSETLALLSQCFDRLTAQNNAALRADGISSENATHERAVEMRCTGVESTLLLMLDEGAPPDAQALRSAFESAHLQRYGFLEADHALEIATARVTSTAAGAVDVQAVHIGPDQDRAAIAEATVCFEGPGAAVNPVSVPVYQRNALPSDETITGPMLIVDANATIVVEPGWQVEVDPLGNLILHDLRSTADEDADAPTPDSTHCDPVRLEIFNNLFMSTAEQMGNTLERVSHSANIKERLDFSCALFSPAGELIANAPHIPVHLGAMGESVKAVLAKHRGAMAQGDVFVTNNPYEGGSHLPDLTVVTPVFSEAGELLFTVANRGHHADIGGITPGSMPPFSTRIEEEGVVLDNLKIVSQGRFDEARFIEVLSSGPYPARNPAERISDLRAQIAANVMGVSQLLTLCRQYSVQVVQAYMKHVRANAAATMRARIRAIPDGDYRFTDAMDDGAPIAARILIKGDQAIVDFHGTAKVHPGNLNAPPAVVVSAVLYVFRTLIDRPIPLNAGCLEPITIFNPPGTMLHPAHPAAVVGGNVETSQRICDVLYGALGILAAGQGTMNNVTFGNANFGYYETICGGAGAGQGFQGASGVHVHMTNTRITDPEVLEHRYPVRVREFALRKNSGGAGAWRGGDGVVRELEFLEAMTVSLLTERRTRAPYGAKGGGPGKPGENSLIRDGVSTPLEGHATVEVQPGDRIRIETPGGGGFGVIG